jgi:biotin transporter BioY
MPTKLYAVLGWAAWRIFARVAKRGPTRGYTVLGWAAWQIITGVAKRKMGQNKVKVGAAATVLAVLVAGLAAARATASDE